MGNKRIKVGGSYIFNFTPISGWWSDESVSKDFKNVGALNRWKSPEDASGEVFVVTKITGYAVGYFLNCPEAITGVALSYLKEDPSLPQNTVSLYEINKGFLNE